MAGDDALLLEAVIEAPFRDGRYFARLANGHRLLVTPPRGKHEIPVQLHAGQKVTLTASPYDLSRARFVSLRK